MPQPHPLAIPYLSAMGAWVGVMDPCFSPAARVCPVGEGKSPQGMIFPPAVQLCQVTNVLDPPPPVSHRSFLPTVQTSAGGAAAWAHCPPIHQPPMVDRWGAGEGVGLRHSQPGGATLQAESPLPPRGLPPSPTHCADPGQGSPGHGAPFPLSPRS